MGKRTKFQKKETAQLVCMIRRTDGSQETQPGAFAASEHTAARKAEGLTPESFLPVDHPLKSDILLEELSLVSSTPSLLIL